MDQQLEVDPKLIKTCELLIELRHASFRTNPAAFRDYLTIDSDPPERFGIVMQPWQRMDFEAVDPAWLAIAGLGLPAERTKSYCERPRGHSKTDDLAIMVAWAIAFSPKMISGVAAAGDRDQAGLLRDKLEKIVLLNPWLRDRIVIQQKRAFNPATGSQIEVISSDVATSWGLLCDFILCDELTAWPDGKGEKLWHSLWSTSGKRAQCVVAIISNAGGGLNDSWQWDIRQVASTSDSWHFHSLDGPQAPWISEKTLAEQRRLLPPIVYQRVWQNQWTSGRGEGLNPDDISASLDHGIDQLQGPQAGWSYAAGLDLGLKHDAAALVIVGKDGETGRYRLVKVMHWKPTEAVKVSISNVELAIMELHSQFHFKLGYADPWQGELLVDRLKAQRVPFETYPFTDPNLDGMARHLINQFTDRNLMLYQHAGLVSELHQTSITEKPSGKIRLEWPRSDQGHGDIATALSLALIAAKELVATSARAGWNPSDNDEQFEKEIAERTSMWMSM